VHRDALFRDTKDRVVAPPLLPDGVRLADTHAHLDMLHDPGLALARAAANAVSYVATVIDPTEDPAYTCNSLDGWIAEACGLIDEWGMDYKAPTVSIIAGCHPHNASRYDEGIEQALRATLADARARALGEIGLDYHYDKSPRDTQQAVFRRQLQLAHELGVPVALHVREAHADGLRILVEEGLPQAGVLLHCFNLDYATLEPFLELGCHVAFGGPLTFKKSDEVREAARRAPLERVVTETDAPFMAPHPVRGVVCGPEHVAYTARCLAEACGRGDDPALYHTVFQNALDFFREAY
jgi:TatD DNase family protein